MPPRPRPLRATWLACWEVVFCPRQPQSTWVPSPCQVFCPAWRERVGDRARGEDRTRLKKRSSCSGRKLRRAKASSTLHRCGRATLWPLLRVCWRQTGGVKPACGWQPGPPLPAASPRDRPAGLCRRPWAGRRAPGRCALATRTTAPRSRGLRVTLPLQTGTQDEAHVATRRGAQAWGPPHLGEGLEQRQVEPLEEGEGLGAASHLAGREAGHVGQQVCGQALEHLRLVEAQLA